MRGFATGLSMLFRLCWVVNIVLGILFWTGTLTGLVPVHMLIGLIVALLLVILSIMAGMRGAPMLLVGGVVVAILLPVVGLGQSSWLVGSSHWLIRILHLLVAVVAIGIAERAAAQVRRAPASAPTV